MFYTYILRSESDPSRFYHGHTSDFRRRLLDHNSGDNASTRHGRPWVIAWYGAFETETAAMPPRNSLIKSLATRASRVPLVP